MKKNKTLFIFFAVCLFPIFANENPSARSIEQRLAEILDSKIAAELVQKKEDIRKSLIDWFSQKTVYELYTMPENEVKKEVLAEINSILNLSRIKRIYFKDFVILE